MSLEERSRKIAIGLSAGALLGIAIGGLLIAIGHYAAPSGSIAERTGAGPAVIELFTSQGCYNCPPAEQLLGELIKEDREIVALEFHVDYWDTQVYGKHGIHKDPFSSPEHTNRQQTYNQARIEGQRGVFTPQVVVNGRYATVGGREKEVRKGVQIVDRPELELIVTHKTSSGDANKTGLTIQLEGAGTKVPGTAHLWLAIFDKKKTTNIRTGENHDKSLTSHHIVREYRQLTTSDGIAELLSPDSSLGVEYQIELKEGQGCAVLVQEASLGPIYAASYCPREVWPS